MLWKLINIRRQVISLTWGCHLDPISHARTRLSKSISGIKPEMLQETILSPGGSSSHNSAATEKQVNRVKYFIKMVTSSPKEAIISSLTWVHSRSIIQKAKHKSSSKILSPFYKISGSITGRLPIREWQQWCDQRWINVKVILKRSGQA